MQAHSQDELLCLQVWKGCKGKVGIDEPAGIQDANAKLTDGSADLRRTGTILENLMDIEVMELKVCEGCGNLWVRCRAIGKVYCLGCAIKLADYPQVGAARRPGRKRKLTHATRGGCK